MKILVTGGAGFIGSHLLQLLLGQHGVEVFVYDNLSSGCREHVPQGVRLEEGDVRDEAKLARLFASEGFDAVVHLAAQTIVPYSLILLGMA